MGARLATEILTHTGDAIGDGVRQQGRRDRPADARRLPERSLFSNGIRSAAQILLEIGDGSAFKSAGHLAAYAGIAPVTHRSGSSIRGEHLARSTNRKLERALFLSPLSAIGPAATVATVAECVEEPWVVLTQQSAQS